MAQLFDCGDDDLNEYFRKDVISHIEQLFTQTYYLYAGHDKYKIVALIDFCNDSIRKEELNSRAKRKLPNTKRAYGDYPAVKITRLGVQKEFQGHQIGTHIINIAKRLFLHDNRTGCRYITVDAYQNATGFYKKNNFDFFSDIDKDKRTRAMFFDLKRIML